MKLAAFVVSLVSLTSLTGAADSITGTWTRGDPEKGGGRLLTKHEGKELRFQLECWRGAPSYNSGFVEGKLTLSNRQGTFTRDGATGRCELHFSFSDDSVELRYLNESVDCGFGHGVFANGDYERTSSEDPKFNDGDPRVRR